MSYFPTADELYTIIQTASIPFADPNGDPSKYYILASKYAFIECVSDLYQQLKYIYENNYPQTVNDVDKILKWEQMVFGFTLADNLTLSERIDRVLTKIRNPTNFTIPDLIALVKAIIGSDKDVRIIEWNNDGGTWVLDESELGVDTYLGGYNPANLLNYDCSKTAADYGLTEEEFLEIKTQAYTYEVQIYGYTLTDLERSYIDRLLKDNEPARSLHVITDNL